MTERTKQQQVITALVSSITVLAVVFSLLGYGAACAIETVFGIPRDLAYDSALDLLHLSSHAISGQFSLKDMFSPSNERFRHLVYGFALVGILLTVLTVLVRALFARADSQDSATRTVCQFSIRYCSSAKARAIAFLGKHRHSFWPLCLIFVPWVMYLVVFLAAVVSIVPVWGWTVASRDFTQWIVDADYCTPTPTREDRMALSKKDGNGSSSGDMNGAKPTVTPCVAIIKDGARLAQGRHITSTSTHVILFDPITGKGRVIPKEGVWIETAESPGP